MADINTVSHELEIVKACSTRIIERSDLHKHYGGFKSYVNVRLPFECDKLVLQLVELYTADNLQKVVFTHHADWWEAVKARFAPQWFLRRYPIRYTIDEIDIKAIWQGYKMPVDAEKYGPVLPYVLQRTYTDGGVDGK